MVCICPLHENPITALLNKEFKMAAVSVEMGMFPQVRRNGFVIAFVLFSCCRWFLDVVDSIH